MRQFFRSLASFNLREKRSLLFLAFALAIVLALRWVAWHWKNRPVDVEAEYVYLAEEDSVRFGNSFVNDQEALNFDSPPRSKERPEYFDPNTLDSAGWVRLGLSPRQSAVVVNYRRRGGVFRKPEDIQRLYVITPTFYSGIAPYIRLDSAVLDRLGSEGGDPGLSKEKFFYNRQESHNGPVQSLEINSASPEDLAKLPGVSKQLADNIVRYREKLQGFDSLGQLRNIWGMRYETFQLLLGRLHLKPPQRQRLNLNYATEEEMVSLPGIGPYRAHLLKRSRQTQGFFQSMQDLRLRKILPDSVLLLLENRVEF